MLPIRGVRSLERAGALIAGADDADALFLDPAGLGHLAGDGRRALLFDVAYVYQPVTYTPPGQPPETNQLPGAPIPTIAGALGIGDRLVIAGGIAEPYAGSHRYDATGAQRYASVSIAGSTFAVVAVGAAYVVSPRLRVGATLQDQIALLDLQLVASACPGTMTCAPTDASFDLPAHVHQAGYLSPSGSIGVQYEPSPVVAIGAAIQAPARVWGTGTIALTPPTSSVFTGQAITGDQASLRFWLPPALRVGVEYHPGDALRVEAALDVELWSLHDQISIEPHGVMLGGSPVGPMTIARGYRTSFAPSLGAEYHAFGAMFGAGVGYETAAAPAGEVSVLAVDASKLIVGLGGGYAARGWQIGAAAGYARLADVAVTDPKVAQLQPIRPIPQPIYINGGTYQSSYLVAGIRAARRF